MRLSVSVTAVFRSVFQADFSHLHRRELMNLELEQNQFFWNIAFVLEAAMVCTWRCRHSSASNCHPSAPAKTVDRFRRVFPWRSVFEILLSIRPGACMPSQGSVLARVACASIIGTTKVLALCFPSNSLYKRHTPTRAPLSPSIPWLAIRCIPRTAAADRNSESPGVDSLLSRVLRSTGRHDVRRSDGLSRGTSSDWRVCTGWAAGADRR